MNDIGIDLSSALREPLKREELSKYDKIISMETERQSPGWLLGASNYIYWYVKDPRGQDYETTALVRDDILSRVEKLIQDNKKQSE